MKGYFRCKINLKINYLCISLNHEKMKTLIIHTEEDKVQIIKDFLNSIKVKFETKTSSTEESVYSDDFNQMMKQGDLDIKKGKGSKVSFNDSVWK